MSKVYSMGCIRINEFATLSATCFLSASCNCLVQRTAPLLTRSTTIMRRYGCNFIEFLRFVRKHKRFPTQAAALPRNLKEY